VLLLLLAGLAFVAWRRRDPADPSTPAAGTGEPMTPGPAFAPFGANPVIAGHARLGFAAMQATPSPLAPPPSPTLPGWSDGHAAATLPPQLAAACVAPVPPRPAAAATRLPSRYQGVAA
jgi:hypothetical protein